MKKLPYLIILVLAGFFVWHVILAKAAESDPYILAVHPISNQVEICLDASSILENFEDHDAYKLGKQLDEHIYENLGGAILAKHLNKEARARFDLWAMILPYTVSVTDSPQCTPVTPVTPEATEKAGGTQE